MWYDLHNYIRKLVLELQENRVWKCFLMCFGAAVMCFGAAVMCVGVHRFLQFFEMVSRNGWVDVAICAIGFVCFVKDETLERWPELRQVAQEEKAHKMNTVVMAWPNEDCGFLRLQRPAPPQG